MVTDIVNSEPIPAPLPWANLSRHYSLGTSFATLVVNLWTLVFFQDNNGWIR